MSRPLRCWPGCIAEVVGAEQPNCGLRVVVIERDRACSLLFRERVWTVQPLGLAKVYRWPRRKVIGTTCGPTAIADSVLRPLDPQPGAPGGVAGELVVHAEAW